MNLREMLLGSLIGLTSCATNDYNNHGSSYTHDQENGKTDHNTNQSKKDVISMERIEELMKRCSVDEILKEEYENGTIEHLVYDPKAPEESAKKYKDFVFQEDLKAEDRKPVLAFLYHDVKVREEHDSVMRQAIIFKELKKIYNDEIKTIGFRCPLGKSNDPELQKFMDKYHTIDMPKFMFEFLGEIHKKTGGYSIPSIALYGKFDLLKGETKEKNDGKIKHLDTLSGGPAKDKSINNWTYHELGATGWMDSNIVKPNGEYVVRVNNSAKPKKEYYNKSISEKRSD